MFCIPAKDVFRVQVFHLEYTLEGILASGVSSIANAQLRTLARKRRNKPVASHGILQSSCIRPFTIRL